MKSLNRKQPNTGSKELTSSRKPKEVARPRPIQSHLHEIYSHKATGNTNRALIAAAVIFSFMKLDS